MGVVGDGVPLCARVARVTGRMKRHDTPSLSWWRFFFGLCCFVCCYAAVGSSSFILHFVAFKQLLSRGFSLQKQTKAKSFFPLTTHRPLLHKN